MSANHFVRGRALVDARATQARAACLCDSALRMLRCRRTCAPSWALAAARPSTVAINASVARMLESSGRRKTRRRDRCARRSRAKSESGARARRAKRRTADRRRDAMGEGAQLTDLFESSGRGGVGPRFRPRPLSLRRCRTKSIGSPVRRRLPGVATVHVTFRSIAVLEQQRSPSSDSVTVKALSGVHEERRGPKVHKRN